MLYLDDSVDFDKLDSDFDLYTEVYEDDGGWRGSCRVHSKDGIEIDESTRHITGIDNTELDLLYDLIQLGIVKKENKV